MTTTLHTPVLPYAGTSGFAASASSSRAGTISQDISGDTLARQQSILAKVEANRSNGMTVKEYREAVNSTEEHHGRVSGAFSNLHKAGLLTRLTETREGYEIYVLPQYVFSRNTAQHGSEREVTIVYTGPSRWIEAGTEISGLRPQAAPVPKRRVVKTR